MFTGRNKLSTLAPQGSNVHSFIYVNWVRVCVSEAGEAGAGWMADSFTLYGGIKPHK